MQNNYPSSLTHDDSELFADCATPAYSYAKSRAKPDKGRRRKHEDLYPLHFQANDGEHTMFTGDLRKDLEIFSVLVTSSGYRPGQELLIPEVLLSAVIERFVNGGGVYSYHAIFRDLDTSNAKADLNVVVQIVLKRINNYVPSPKGRKVRKYVFQLFVKNFPSPFTSVPKVTHKWRSDMFASAFNDAIKEINTTAASAKVNEVVANIDTAPLVNKIINQLDSKLPNTAQVSGRAAGRGIVEGVMSKFTETFQSAMSTMSSTLSSLPKWVSPLLKTVAALTIFSLIGFFGYKLVTYCFPSVFGTLPTHTSDGFGDTLSTFADWLAEGFEEIKSATSFSSSSAFAKIKDSIVIMTFFEKFSNAVQGVTKLFTAIINWICTKITGHPYFDDAIKLQELFKQCNDLITFLENTPDYVPLEKQEEYIEKYALCTSLADGIFKLDPALYTRMHSILAIKLPIFEKFSRAVRSGTMRQEPVLIWFTGGAGTYKSNTVDHLYQCVFSCLKHKYPDAFADIQEPKWHSGLVGVRSIEDKFWSNYAENWAFTMDDVFQTTSQQGMEAEANILFMAKQRSRYPLTSAGVSEKGTLFFKSKIICCTSNYPESLFTSVGCPGMQFAPAFHRRRDFIVELAIDPNTAPGTINTPSMWNNIVFNVKRWSHKQHKHIPMYSAPGLIGLQSLVEMVAQRYDSYYQAHKSASTFSAADIMFPPVPPTSPPNSNNSDSDDESSGESGTGVSETPQNSPRISVEIDGSAPSSTKTKPEPLKTSTNFYYDPHLASSTMPTATDEPFEPISSTSSTPSNFSKEKKEEVEEENFGGRTSEYERAQFNEPRLKEDGEPSNISWFSAKNGRNVVLNFKKRLQKIGKKITTDDVARAMDNPAYTGPTSDMYGWFKKQVFKVVPSLNALFPYETIPPCPIPVLTCCDRLNFPRDPVIPNGGAMNMLDIILENYTIPLYRFLNRINHPYKHGIPSGPAKGALNMADPTPAIMHIVDLILYRRDPSLLPKYKDMAVVENMRHMIGFETNVKYGIVSSMLATPISEFFETYFACVPFPVVSRLIAYLDKCGTDTSLHKQTLRDALTDKFDEQVPPDFTVADYVGSIIFYATSGVLIGALIGGAIRLVINGLQSLGVLSSSQMEYFSDSGDTQLEKSQMEVISHLRKAKPKQLRKVEERTSDHSASHTGAYKRIMSNMFLVDFNKVTSGTLDRSPNWCWFMTANIMVIPTHYLARAPFSSITIYPGFQASAVDNEIISWKDIVPLKVLDATYASYLAKRDLTALYIPGLRYARKDMWNQLPHNSSLKEFENYQGIRRLGFDLTDEHLSLQFVECTSSPILYGLSKAKFPFKTDLVAIDDYFELKGMEGGQGLCMSPYVPASASVPIVICGFHIASYSRANTSQFAPFTREDYTAIAKAFEPLVSKSINYKPPPGDEFYQSDCAPLVFSDTIDEAVGLRVVHSIDRTVSSSNRSNMIKTIVETGTTHLEPPYPATSAPASLSKRAQVLSWRKLDGRKHFYDSNVFSDPRVFKGSFPSHLKKDYCCRFLSLTQCIEGVPGTHIHSTDIQKASGAPFNTYSIRKSELIIRNSPSSNICVPDWYDDLSLPSSVPSLSFFKDSGVPGLWIHPDLQRWFYWWHHWSRQGYTPLALFSFFLKDELRPMTRVLAEYTRYVNAGELAHTLFCKSVTAYYVDQLETDLSIGIQLGINPFSNDWARLYKRIRTRMDPDNPSAVLHDVSAFDICYQVNYMTNWCTEFQRFFSLRTPHELVFYNCIVAVFVSTLLPAVIWGKIVIIRPRMPSGALMTSTFNTFLNDAEHRQIWYWIYPDTDFDSANAAAFFGDDSILGSIFNEDWNGIVIGEIRKLIFSHNCTESTKDETLVHSQKPENWQFLSRGFREEKGLILAPLKIESIQAMCRYIHKPTDKTVTAQTALNLRIALNEFGLHGREVFEQNLALLQPFLAVLGHEHLYPYTYDQLFDLYIELYSGEKCALSHASFFY